MTPVLAVCASADDVGRIAVAVSRTAARAEETALLNFPLLIRRPPLKGLSDGWLRGGAEDSRAPPSWFGRAGRSFGRAAAAVCLANGPRRGRQSRREGRTLPRAVRLLD